ncbi:FAD-dependent oxidoreductase [Nitrosophilus kaiyonis]|uniref:FAD-dependent oxidoreductase n=1 Tax=Nitrosophilus kaiyonis TaxID=2930200 RepID=UPI0024925BFC|nr:FAD-dependent oxidoreductase [Nitrosophilus kaiyonis]
MKKVAIIGGGVAGVSAAILLKNAKITLFEKEKSLISGPPFCHLHAGGNLYPDISINQCIKLLKESIDFAKTYPFCLDFRPTIIAFPKDYEKEPTFQIKRLEILQKEYKKLINLDEKNSILGDSREYFKLYHKKDLEKLSKKEIVKNPKNFDDWIIPFAKYVDLDNLQYPVIIVNEFGLNIFRLAAGTKMILEKKDNVDLKLNTKVIDIKQKDNRFVVSFLNDGSIKTETFDFIINAAGFRSGEIDDLLKLKRERFVEFKAAYVTKWDSSIKWPEIIFHGKRGTPKGMAQFTPYPNGYFQLHGMNKEITLFNEGLAKSSESSSQPKLKRVFLEKIEKGWDEKIAILRGENAIKHFEKFIKKFSNEAKATKKPLFGAQQIPGNDPELRAAEVSFEKNCARCEIVKVSSAIQMVKNIANEFGLEIENIDKFLKDLDLKKLKKKAKEIAKGRGYPQDLGDITTSNRLFS